MPAGTEQGEWVWLAWAGWRMRVPRDWRPLRIGGGRRGGSMMIGDQATALVQVKWSRRPPDGFDPRRWIAERLARRKLVPARSETAPPGGQFDVLAWVRRADSRRNAERSIWYGYSPHAQLLLEVLIHADRARQKPAAVLRGVLASLGGSRPDGPTDWAVFEASFRSPPGMDVVARRFSAGHMAVLFGSAGDGPRGRRLLLRQVYPVDLALSRRDLAAWMRSGPFAERRRFYPAADPEDWSVPSFGRTLEGLIRRGRKRLPWPLGWAAPRWTVAASARDRELDRLLLAEYDSPEPDGDAAVAEAIGQMNRAALCGLDGV